MADLAFCNPEILKWARVRLGYSVEDAAKKLQISNPDKLRRAEERETNITLNQLSNASRRYGLPMSYFYLPKVPGIERRQTQDFRLNADADAAYTPEMNRVLFWAQDIREDALWLAEEGHYSAKGFSWSAEDKDPTEVIADIREATGANHIVHSNVDAAFDWWRAQIEEMGVLVLETDRYQNFGISGAAIYFDMCPIILLNGTEPYKRKKLFTLAHEFSHLLFRDSSLDEFQATIHQHDGREKLCNVLARKLLLPDDQLVQRYRPAEGKELETISEISKEYKVSRFVVLLALRDLKVISKPEYYELYSVLEDQFQAYRKKIAAQRLKRGSSGGPLPHIMKAKKLGRTYSRGVLSALWTGGIKQTEAVRMLDNLNVKHFEKFAERAFQ